MDVLETYNVYCSQPRESIVIYWLFQNSRFLVYRIRHTESGNEQKVSSCPSIIFLSYRTNRGPSRRRGFASARSFVLNLTSPVSFHETGISSTESPTSLAIVLHCILQLFHRACYQRTTAHPMNATLPLPAFPIVLDFSLLQFLLLFFPKNTPLPFSHKSTPSSIYLFFYGISKSMLLPFSRDLQFSEQTCSSNQIYKVLEKFSAKLQYS